MGCAPNETLEMKEAEPELKTQMINLPPQRSEPLLVLLGLVIVVELLTVLVVGNWIYDSRNSGSQLADRYKKFGSW